MTRKHDAQITRFIEKKKADLKLNPGLFNHLSTILSECGWKKKSPDNLKRIQEQLETAGIFPEPRITTPELGPDTIVRYATKKPSQYFDEYYASRMYFKDERSFSSFVKANFRKIAAFHDLVEPVFEAKLPGRRIDLLCRDRRTDEYVVIEFKHVGDDGVDQVLKYMRTLKAKLSLYGVSAGIRGMIVHIGPTWPKSENIEREVYGFRIDWYRLKIELTLNRIE